MCSELEGKVFPDVESPYKDSNAAGTSIKGCLKSTEGFLKLKKKCIYHLCITMNLVMGIFMLHQKVPDSCMLTLHLLFCIKFYFKTTTSPLHRIISCSPQILITTMLPLLLLFVLKWGLMVLYCFS